jgi:hypothetical protein
LWVAGAAIASLAIACLSWIALGLAWRFLASLGPSSALAGLGFLALAAAAELVSKTFI